MLKDLRESTEMDKKEFANYFNIPLRTVQHWESEGKDSRKCPEYLLELMKYKLEHEGLIKKK